MDPQKILETNKPLIDRIIKKVAGSHNLQSADLEDFRSDFYEKLVQDDYQIIREYGKAAIAPSYLIMVVRNFFLDLYRKEQGRYRPSTKAQELGEPATTLERLMKEKQYSFDDTCEMIHTQYHNLKKTPPTRQFLEDLAIHLNVYEKIGKIRNPLFIPGVEVMTNLARTRNGPDDVMANNEMDTIKSVFEEIVAELKETLLGEDSFIFQAVFDEDTKMSEIVRQTGKGFSRIDRLL
ncbi:MAG: sigma-70 family RNA polymerase sigma factor [SAR324 cluster bacterium]|nr:sigma-70 family RNA polymerase sigma factor [SAR324 cluster bacterium]